MPLQVEIKGSISAAVNKAAQQLEARLTANVQVFATAVFNDLIEQTPKLSGQATANWQVTIGDVNDVFIEVRPRKIFDAGSVDDALELGLSTIEEFEIGGTLTIYNNAPYIQLLNEGYSRQAPAGYVQAIIEANRTLLSTGSVTLT